MNRVLVIPAGGYGRRMGAGIPKQFLSLDGKTVLGVTLERFDSFDLFDRIVVVVPKDHTARTESITAQISTPTIVIEGGKNRRESVFKGLLTLEDFAPQLVVIHDGVRPLIPKRMVTAVIQAAQESGAATVAVSAVDTIGVVKENQLISQPDRKTMYHIQTPQAFRYSLLLEAHRTIKKRVTDDAGLVLAAGHDVAIVDGFQGNIKITAPSDLMLAELFLKNGYVQ
ncbi:2-C-methyl-D-erythritol 4-phosphate cytidylyltransferase [bacterium]|nr:2-C-methyl-D-erythritol 4-phosphate cytidylyltransferase [bacterium]